MPESSEDADRGTWSGAELLPVSGKQAMREGLLGARLEKAYREGGLYRQLWDEDGLSSTAARGVVIYLDFLWFERRCPGNIAPRPAICLGGCQPACVQVR